ncbi:MAG TPA: hypothetical protein VN802_18315 [Stellaceae bacterium]|nr:hypothetical protein [Stellaceae bacterium]
MAHPIHPHGHRIAGAAASPPADQVRLAKEASAGTGTDFRALLASSLQESHHDANAHNTRSSATGAYQFTARTWLDLVRRHGAELGQPQLASQVTVKHGAPLVVDQQMRSQILALRGDTGLAGGLAARYFAENRASLAHSLGRPPSATEVQMAYLLGASGASRLIKAAASEPGLGADKIVPGAVRHNPGLFSDRDGHIKTAGEAVASLSRHFEDGRKTVDSAIGAKLSLLLATDTPVDDETV